jgi:hypothetical protein
VGHYGNEIKAMLGCEKAKFIQNFVGETLKKP